MDEICGKLGGARSLGSVESGGGSEWGGGSSCEACHESCELLSLTASVERLPSTFSAAATKACSSGDEADSEDEVADPKGDVAAEATSAAAPMTRGLTASQKTLVRKARINLGHPETGAFCRLLRQARARLEVIEYVRKEFKCDVCDAQGRAGAGRPAAVPSTYTINRVVLLLRAIPRRA